MQIEREKELYSQIEDLRSQLEREYDFNRALSEYIQQRFHKLNNERQAEQDKPENNWNWSNIDCIQSAINEAEDFHSFVARYGKGP